MNAQALTLADPTQANNTAPSPVDAAKGAVIFGMAVIGAMFGGVGYWAATVPIASGAVAPGEVVVNTNRKTIQHLEGGIIKEIHVKAGDVVKEGDVLIVLDDTQSRATMNSLRGQLLALHADVQRLRAERDNKKAVEFSFDPHLLVQAEGQKLDMLIDEVTRGQLGVFNARNDAIKSQIDIYNQQIKQLEERIAGLDALQQSEKEQRDLVAQELEAVEGLWRDRNSLLSRVINLKRAIAELEGMRGQRFSDIAMARQQIGEAKLAIIDLKNRFLHEVVNELRNTQNQINELDERYRASLAVLERTVIKAPQTGTVVNLSYHTIGGVIPSGQPILEIVPRDDELVIAARIDTQDIDVVRTGLDAQVQLTAYKMRTTPTLSGKVIYVSADRLVDEQGLPFFEARVRISEQSLEHLEGVELYPGMPASVMVLTGERTALDIAIEPIAGSIRDSFRSE